jgi:phosphohistidine phosphatase
LVRLLLLRHAKAEPIESGNRDFDRPLLPRGEAAAKRIGQYLAANSALPDRVLCSPALRTRETARLVLGELPHRPELILPAALYNAPIDTYIEIIREFGDGAGTLLVVGHNPATQQATAELSRPSPDSASLPAAFPTAALAIIDFGLAEWGALALRSGRLVAVVRPRDLPGGAARKG